MQTVRTTLNIDKELLENAARYHPGMTRTAIIEAALRTLVAADAADRLIALGGTAPAARGPRRRRRAKS